MANDAIMQALFARPGQGRNLFASPYQQRGIFGVGQNLMARPAPAPFTPMAAPPAAPQMSRPAEAMASIVGDWRNDPIRKAKLDAFERMRRHNTEAPGAAPMGRPTVFFKPGG